MIEEHDQLNEEEKLKAENDFLKMKLMLEAGAHFGGDGNEELPAGIENQFLLNIMEFEKQFQEHKRIKVFDKIGRPKCFRPASEIPENEIEEAYCSVIIYLNDYGIDFDVCSPNITTKELYRFIIEELFQHEMDDMDMPGWTTNFIYDEFHPDYDYDNTQTAIHYCINLILEKEPLEWMHHYRKENLRLNNHYPLSTEEFKQFINRFKSAYESMELQDIENANCTINENICFVKGTYNLCAKLQNDTVSMCGNWIIEFEADADFDYWYITNVQIEGINF